MDTSLSLFGSSCDSCNNITTLFANIDTQESLPPEPESGNVEYKLKLVHPSKQRFEHLVTQMNWRLHEGRGMAIYEIGVEDNGSLRGLSERDMRDSLHTLKEMALKLGAKTKVLQKHVLDNGGIVAEVLVSLLLSELSEKKSSKRKLL